MIIDHCRDEKELFELYSSRPMPCQYDFEFLMQNPNLFCAYDEKQGFLTGFITIQLEDGELTLSGTSVPKKMPDNIDFIIKVCEAFKDDMYSYTPLRHAGLLLRKAGFKYLGNNKYVRLYNG